MPHQEPSTRSPGRQRRQVPSRGKQGGASRGPPGDPAGPGVCLWGGLDGYENLKIKIITQKNILRHLL